MKHSKNGIFQDRNISPTTVFASLGNEIRLRCLFLAARFDEVCVCEVVDVLQIPQPTISKAFKALKEAGLVADRRDANWTYFRFNSEAPRWVEEIVEAAVAGLSGSHPHAADERAFQKLLDEELKHC
ncbi:MAG: metalloregulator ArsR/SmtB family transcription factor [Pseudomonadota bacterium]